MIYYNLYKNICLQIGGLKMKKLMLGLLMLGLVATGCARKQEVVVDIRNDMRVAAVEQINKSMIFFDFDRFDIKPDYYDVLKQNAGLIKEYKLKVQIAGHADERGTSEYNLALGAQRAMAARDFMVILGVDVNQIDLISYGKEKPLFEGRGEQYWSKNRRDEFRVLKK